MKTYSIALLAFVSFAPACAPAMKHSFALTPNPVMLGPVTRIGGGAEPVREGPTIGFWAHRESGGGGGTSFIYQSPVFETDFDLFKSLGGDTNVLVRGRWECGGSVYMFALEGQTCTFEGTPQ